MNNLICKAQDIETNSWVQGYYVSKVDPLYGFPYHYLLYQGCDKHNIPDSFLTWHKINPDTVCRYTGLNDQHDEPIFEHDWVHTEFGRTCEVVWFSSPSYVGWDLIPVSDFDDPPPNKCTLFSPENLEVIANRFDFDNTELMEEQ